MGWCDTHRGVLKDKIWMVSREVKGSSDKKRLSGAFCLHSCSLCRIVSNFRAAFEHVLVLKRELVQRGWGITYTYQQKYAKYTIFFNAVFNYTEDDK